MVNSFIISNERNSYQNKLIKIVLALIIAFTGFVSHESYAQVITNNGAYINLNSGVFLFSKDGVNNAGSNILNNGNFNLSGNFTNTGISGGNGFYRIGGNWTNNGTFNYDQSSVIFNGSVNQLIVRPGGENFYNLSVGNTGPGLSKIIILNDISISNSLSLSTGNIDAGTFFVYLNNPAAASLVYTSSTGSRILGKFERKISESGTYLFPLGSVDNYNPLNLKTNSSPSPGSVLSQFFRLSPAGSGFPIKDPPVEIYRVYSEAYWLLTAKNGFASSDFNINMNASGFTDSIHDNTRLIRRNDAGIWEADGSHQDADTVNHVVYRNSLKKGISGLGTKFALGRARPLITDQPDDTTVCEETYPFFEITATGSQTLRYAWYKVSSPTDILIQNSDPHYSGARTHTLTIMGAALSDAGLYYCIVTDRFRNSTRSDSVMLIVKKIPRAILTNANQPQKCSNVTFDPVILGLTYWDNPGTTFYWTRTSPDSVITTNVPLSGTASNIGDVIQGTFDNLTDKPVTITFYITPIGPDPTYCHGAAVPAYITVNPTPKVIPVNIRPAICYGGTTQIILTSKTQMTSGNIKFDYLASKTGGSLLVGTVRDTTNLSPNHVISFRYLNNSDTVQSVHYRITPRVDNAICPSGPLVESMVNVHAEGLQSILVTKPLTCNGGAGMAALRAILSKGASPYQIDWDGPLGFDAKNVTDVIDLINIGKYVVKVTDNLGCFNKDSVPVVSVYANPYVYVTPINPGGYHISCIGSSDAKMKISATGGITNPYRFWLLKNDVPIDSGVFTNNYNGSDPTTYKDYTNMGAGTYTLIIKDKNDCERRLPVSLKVPPVITVVFKKSQYNGGYNVSCKGYNDGSAWVETPTGGRGGYTYRWFTYNGSIPGPVNTNRIDNITAGKYYLETRDILGCPKIDSVTVTEPNGMTLAAAKLSSSPDKGFNVSCNGAHDGSIDITVAGGSGNYLFNWTGPDGFSATSEDISGLKAGVYTCTVKDLNGCILTPSPTFTLTEPSVLSIAGTSSVSADGSFEINCNGGTGSIDITATGGSAGSYSYTWSTADGSGIIQGQPDQNQLRAGTYHLEVKDLNTCSAVKDFTLREPPVFGVLLTPSHITCLTPGFNNGSIDLKVTGGVGPYSYSWSNGSTTEDISGLTAGYYSVNVTYNNVCSKKDSVKVNLPPPLTYERSLSSFNSFNVSCNGRSDGSITVNPLTGLQPYSYSWSGPNGYTSSSKDISGLRAGSYNFLITDINHCTASEVITLTEPGPLGVKFNLSQSNAGGYNINCAGDSSAVITAEPVNQVNEVQYIWSDGATGKIRENMPAGVYGVIITDSNNCQAGGTTTVTEPDSLKLNLSIDKPFCPDMPDGQVTANVTGGVKGTDYIYRWSDKSGESSINEIPIGFYKVVVEDMNGCAAKDSIRLEPVNESCLIVPGIISPNGDLINDYWNIGMTELYPNMEVKIFNRRGRLMWRSERGYSSKPWDGKSNGSILPIDSYHYVIDLHNGTKPVIGTITIVK